MDLSRRRFIKLSGLSALGAVVFNGCDIPEVELQVQSRHTRAAVGALSTFDGYCHPSTSITYTACNISQTLSFSRVCSDKEYGCQGDEKMSHVFATVLRMGEVHLGIGPQQ